MPIGWFWLSFTAFVLASAALLVAGYVLLRIVGQLLPLLDQTKHEMIDLGDLASDTMGHASETMDIIEARVEHTLGQAEVSGRATAGQALSVGTALTGIYMASRALGAVRGVFAAKKRPANRKSGWLPFGKR
ncbi:MAG TPA: hypothetical protein VKT77_20170 [Chthonomonadaceae bacterium]|nr:hypothetical protein [Chthonomonadaceae bacterium]